MLLPGYATVAERWRIAYLAIHELSITLLFDFILVLAVKTLHVIVRGSNAQCVSDHVCSVAYRGDTWILLTVFHTQTDQVGV